MSVKAALPSIINTVSPDGCRIINTPERVWVFGGQIADKKENPQSLRDSFLRQALELPPDSRRPWLANLCKPEDFQDWWAFSDYKDLLAFERDACYLAQAIILFAESPGALTELGLIASTDYLAQQTLVVVERKYDKERSFLRLGPLKRIDSFEGLCFVGDSEESSLSKEDFQIVVEFLDKWFPNAVKNQKFDASSQMHQILLLANLVDLLLISKEDEINNAAMYFNICLGNQRLREILSLLDFFELIKICKIGKEVFYIQRSKRGAPWIDYTGLSSEGRFDRMRFKTGRKSAVDQNPRLKHILRGE